MTAQFPPPSPADKIDTSTPKSPYFGTRLIHADAIANLDNVNAVIPAISLSTTFKQKAAADHHGFEYSRAGNPNRLALESLLASLELPVDAPAELQGPYSPSHLPPALAFSSGSAATATIIQSIVGSAGHLISVNDVYGGSNRYFNRVASLFGVETTFLDMAWVDSSDVEEDKLTRRVSEAFKGNTKLVWIETPTNPTLSLVDIQLISRIAHGKGAYVVVDNTFCSPYFQKPLTLGADIVCHSVTKSINGHSDVVGGALVTKIPSLLPTLRFHQNSTGSVPSPFDCWLTIRGARTLEIRSQRAASSALKIVQWLEDEPLKKGWITEVIYQHHSPLAWRQLAPEAKEWIISEGYSVEKGFPYTGMLSIRLRKSEDQISATNKFLTQLSVFSLAESLGGIDSLANLPSLMTHASLPAEHRALLGIDDALVRLSVGVEDPRDLISDLKNAFEHAFGEA